MPCAWRVRRDQPQCCPGSAVLPTPSPQSGRGPADQALLPHGVRLVQEAKGTRWSDLTQVISVGEVYAESLTANQLMGKVNGVGNGVSVGRVDRDELVAFPQLQFPPDPHIGT